MKKGATPKATASRPNAPGKNYLVYGANFHGSYLDTVHNVFLEQVKGGLRRKIFVINFDQMKEKQAAIAEAPAKNVGKKSAKEKPVTPLQMLLKSIAECRSEYDRITKEIEKEKRFDMLVYWLGNAETTVMFEDPILTKKESIKDSKTKVKTRRSQRISTGTTLMTELSFDLTMCTNVIRKEHHSVGRPVQLSKRKYIEDHPQNIKIIIVIVGNLDQKMYHDLLSHGEPLVGIVHFVPGQMPYDIMVPNKIKETFREETYEEIKQLFNSLRDPDIFKPTGLFKQELPELSYCLAQNLRFDIFNQLTWYFFDLEMLRKYYHDYYVVPYHHVNVIMDKKKNPQENYQFLQSLGTSGHFIKSSLPASASNIFTASMYLHNILNSFEEEDDLVLTESEILLYTYGIPLSIASYDKSMECSHIQQRAFNSITLIKKFNRIMVEDANQLLCKAVSTANQKIFRSVYSTCLEYYLLRDFIRDPILEKPKKAKPLQLPIFIKFYSTQDSVLQRTSELISRYNDFKTYKINRRYRLYHFKTTYNELFEEETDVVLPSCLCYRDFTLFHLEEFQKWLVTPEQRNKELEDKTTDEERLKAKEKNYNIAENLYIRPNSLKALYPSITFINTCSRPTLPFTGKYPSKGRESKSVSIILDPTLIKKLVDCDYIGLPPQHPLLHGYTLDDVLQELNTKNSKYFFEEGFLRLYEEKFLRKYTNRKLELCVHDNCMNLNSVSPQDPMVAPTVRITAKNEVAVRIEPHAEEVAKVIITYPNGLSIFYQEDLVEQYWHMEHTFRNECKRVFTPYAAVIVYYKEDNVVLVMRYNGEVYHLYQYEEEEEEEGLEEDDEQIWDPASSYVQAMSGGKSDNTNLAYKIADNISKQVVPDADMQKSKQTLKSNVETAKSTSHISRGSLDSLLENQSKRLASLFAIPSLSITDFFINELTFINHLKNVYSLRYVHLKITAASGRVAKISSSDVMSDGGQLKYVEWHDYVEDESYCMRRDGVKFLWTRDKFKCFHADGTRFVSRTEEYLEEFEICDEFDAYISTSSSHINEEQEANEQYEEFKSKADRGFSGYTYPCEKGKGKRKGYKIGHRMLYEEGIGEEFEEPNIYVGYNCNDILIQHRHYAAVRFEIVNNSIYNIHLDVFAIDGIHITHDIVDRKFLDSIYKEKDENDDNEDFKSKSTESGEEKKFLEDEEAPVFVPVLKVSFENKFRVAVTPNDCHMLAYLERYNDLEEVEIDAFDFILDFKWDLHKIFYSFIKKMNQFKNYKKPKSKELFFIESVSLKGKPRLQPRGFEFYDELPELTDLHVAKSNTLIELIPLQNIDERMQNEYAHYKKDMLKFPRFRKRDPKDTEIEFPPILSVNTYCKVPRALRSTSEIHKFLDPFDAIDFKHQRYHFKEALFPFLKPNLLFEQRKLMSSINWKLHKEAHKRYLHEEQQRTSLYNAMLKYKEYPRYFPFMQKMCGKVENIDFVEFFRVMYLKKAAADAKREKEELEKAQEELLIGPRRRRLMSECHRRSLRSHY